MEKLKVKIKVTLRLTVSQLVSLDVEPQQIFIIVWQLRSCFCGSLSLTRGRVCLLYMLLALSSAVFLGSESLGTRDLILLSQFWDFPFRRLLRLAGSRRRYSNPPPRGRGEVMQHRLTYIVSRRTYRKQVNFLAMDVYCCPELVSTDPLHSNGCPSSVESSCRGNVFTELLPSNRHIRHNTKKVRKFML
jgi:hypothetical protein